MPTLLLEQNAVPGLTNRLLARVVSAAAVTFESTRAVLRQEGICRRQSGSCGVLARAAMRAGRRAPRRAPRVLIFGGSQGAHAINMAMVEAAPRLAAAARRWQSRIRQESAIWSWSATAYRRAGLAARVEPFLDAMDREMKRGRPRRLPRRRDDARRADGGGQAGGAGAAADGDRRSPAQERRGAGRRRRGGDDRAEGPDRRAAGRRGSPRCSPTRPRRERDGRGRARASRGPTPRA